MLEAESIAQLTPGHELIEELAGSVAAIAVQVPSNLEGRDHSKVVVCCSSQSPAPTSPPCTVLPHWQLIVTGHSKNPVGLSGVEEGVSGTETM